MEKLSVKSPPVQVMALNRQQIRSALKLWPDAHKLGEHPLAHLNLVDRRRQSNGQNFADTILGRGVALRYLLSETIEQLKPAGASPVFTQPSWRHYYILKEQFLNHRRAQDIQDEMGISESGYFADQRDALDYLANALREQEEILGQVPALAPDSALPTPPPAGVVISTPSNLPQPPTPFIGREEERQHIAELLARPDCRLLSLVGPGGMGKTRLAIQTAHEYAESHQVTAVFVPLDGIETAELMVPAIAKALQYSFDTQEAPRPQLISFLRSRHLLLVLDNFEHIISQGVQLISDLLAQTPQVKILVTSRERLNLRGEWVLAIQGLKVPEAPEALTMREYSAVSLFLRTLERMRGDVPIAADELAEVVKICHMVEGLPLALELAASWGNFMACDEIAQEIQSNLDFLGGAFRDLPERHQSLRAVFNHSWVLLSLQEQAVFRQLSIFRGSFSREAAKQVAQASLPILHTLVSKSLLVVGDDGRFAIHALLRQYANEKLQEQPAEWQETQDKHGRYFIHFLRQHIPLLKEGGRQHQALAEAELEMENVRQAWRWALNQGQAHLLLETAEAVYLFYSMTNRIQEGSDTVQLLINKLEGQADHSPAEPQLLGVALGIQGRFRYNMGQSELSRTLFKRALDLVREHGTPHNIALVSMLAIQANILEEPYKAPRLYGEALALFEALGDSWGMAHCHVKFVAYLRQSQAPDSYGRQKDLLRQSLQLRQQIGDQRGIAHSLNYLGDMAYERGIYEEAQQYAEASLKIYEELGDNLGRAYALNHLGQVAGTTGQYGQAQKHYHESLRILREYGNPRELSICLDCVGYITYLLGDWDRAEQHYQESLSLSRESNDPAGTAWSLHNLGDVMRARGQYAEARRLYNESQELHKLADPLSWGRATSLDKLGRVALQMGDGPAAEAYFWEALDIAFKTERYREVADAVLNLAKVYLQRGKVNKAAEMVQAVLNHQATAKEARDEAEGLQEQLPVPAQVRYLNVIAEEILYGR